jgi:hypothetical protein
MKNIVFAIIADRDTTFFLNIARELKEIGYNASFITFYEPAKYVITKQGFDVFSIHEKLREKNKADSLGIDNEYFKKNFNLDQFIKHEMLTFNIKDEKKLKLKTNLYISVLDNWIRNKRPDIVIQELGGFIAPLSLFCACANNNVRHVFIEPGFFKGTLAFLVDTTVFKVSNTGYSEISQNFAINYINKYNESKTVSVPDKDIHHFKDATLSKIFNLPTLYKLVKKIYVKYICREGQEYDAIANHSIRNISMIFNRQIIKNYYIEANLLEHKQYVYYPLHVPLDFQLTVRSPQWLDQIYLLEKVCDILPSNYLVVAKEHPAAIGAYSYRQLKPLISRDNFVLINPQNNSYDIIKHSAAVLTINSKVGAEALIQCKPVFVLGEAFYNDHSLINKLPNLDKLQQIMENDNKLQSVTTPNIINITNFLSQLHEHVFYGELYINDKENILSITNSLDLIFRRIDGCVS